MIMTVTDRAKASNVSSPCIMPCWNSVFPIDVLQVFTCLSMRHSRCNLCSQLLKEYATSNTLLVTGECCPWMNGWILHWNELGQCPVEARGSLTDWWWIAPAKSMLFVQNDYGESPGLHPDIVDRMSFGRYELECTFWILEHNEANG